MEIPDDAEPDEYEITLIYEKDGIEHEFSIENYPKGDPEWTFVEQQSKLIKKGYEAPIHDFEILTMEYDDITYDILESEDPVTLVTVYDLKKTDRKQMDKLMTIIHERPNVYFLTGSPSNEIEEFAEQLGWDEETMMSVFCFIDPVTLKTIVRANPGMVVVQNGVIIDKHNFRQL